MSEVPLSMKELEEVVYKVSLDLLEDMAINNEIAEEDLPDWTNMCVNIASLCINRYMHYFNELVNSKALAAAKWMTQNEK